MSKLFTSSAHVYFVSFSSTANTVSVETLSLAVLYIMVNSNQRDLGGHVENFTAFLHM